MDTESYIQSLLVSNPLRESTLRAMIKALQLPEGSRDWMQDVESVFHPCC